MSAKNRLAAAEVVVIAVVGVFNTFLREVSAATDEEEEFKQDGVGAEGGVRRGGGFHYTKGGLSKGEGDP